MRVGLFLPQYVKDEATGELNGRGTGYAAMQIAPALAQRLGVAAEFVGYPAPKNVVACLKAGECDMAFLGIEPSRVAELDFSPAIFEFDYTYLVPAGSPVRQTADADRPDLVIAVVEGHASSLALQMRLRHAEMLGAETPDQAFDNLRTGRAQALACPRDVLLDFAATLPDARVLDDAYGANRVGIAIRKGDAALLACVRDFVEEIKASGFLRRVVESDHLRGFRVAVGTGPMTSNPT